LFFESWYLNINLFFNFITNFFLLIFLVFVPLLTFSLDFIFILFDKLFFFKSKISFNFHNSILIILLVYLSLFSHLFLSFCSNEWILSFVCTNRTNWHFNLLLWLVNFQTNITQLLVVYTTSWNIWSSFFLSLEFQKLLSIFFVQRMIIHFLLGYRINIENLIIFIKVCLPRFRYWSLKTFLCNK
jgi:hypothetical protein